MPKIRRENYCGWLSNREIYLKVFYLENFPLHVYNCKYEEIRFSALPSQLFTQSSLIVGQSFDIQMLHGKHPPFAIGSFKYLQFKLCYGYI
jgi:hypothetical protein